MNKFLGYVALVAIIIAVGYFAWLRVAAPDADLGDVATSTLPAVAGVSTITVTDATSTYKIDVQYPQFGIPDIDAQIKDAVDSSIAEIQALPVNPPDMASPQNELTVRFSDAYVGSDIISVKVVISEYTGGAHPNSTYTGLNFDRVTGKLLTLDDVLPLIDLDLTQLSTLASVKLKGDLGDGFFSDGAGEDPANFNSFLVSKDSVTFIFQPYQVAAYAAGPQEVVFPRVR